MMLALNAIEKFVKEKWGKIGQDNDKIVIRYFLVDNLNTRLSSIDTNLSDKRKQYLMTSINKLNYIIFLIASKDWPKLWPTLIEELCNRAKKDYSYISENCIKLLLLLSDNLNSNYKKLMTAKKNIKLSCQICNEQNLIFNLVKFYVVEKSNQIISYIFDNNFLNLFNQNEYYLEDKDLLASILKQSIKLFDEFINWFEIENILDESIISSLLNILKKELCKNEIIDCFGTLFKFELNKLEGQNEEKLRLRILDIYDSFITIFHNDIVKRKNYLEQIELITSSQKEKIDGFEKFTFCIENCLISFFKANFEFIKEKSNLDSEFLNKYNNSIQLGLQYLFQFTELKNEQIKNNVMEFWYYIVFDLFTLGKNQNKMNKINNNSHNSNNSSNIFNDSTKSSISNCSVENREILVDYLKINNIYNKCFVHILDNLREYLLLNMPKPLEIKIKINESNKMPSEGFNQDLQETTINVLKYLTIMEPEKTKNLIITGIMKEKKNDDNNYSSMDLDKINSLCWSAGIISGTMNEELELDFFVCLCQLLIMMQKQLHLEKRRILAFNLLFVVSKYLKVICSNKPGIFIIIKKLTEFFVEDSSELRDYACEILYRISLSQELIQKNEKYGIDFIKFLMENLKKISKNLNSAQLMMFYESIGNIINKINDQEVKQNYFFKLIENSNKLMLKIINAKNDNINYLNNSNVITILRFIITFNERICYSMKAFYWLYGCSIFKEIINMLLYYNVKLNMNLNSNVHNSNSGVKTEEYESIISTILKYLTSLVKNIDNIQIIKNDMLLDFGVLIDKFTKNPIQNKNPNMVLLFSAVIDVCKNQDYELIYRIWQFFGQKIFNLIINDKNNVFQELAENFFILIKSLVSNSTETFYVKYNSIPKNLIDMLNYGVNSNVPCIYEISLETLSILLENIFKINLKGIDPIKIIKEFYFNYFERIFYFVFGNMIDGSHQNGIKTQIQILQFLIKNLNNYEIFDTRYKVNFQQKLRNDLPKIGNNLSSNQIDTFTLSLFNYSDDSHDFGIIIKDFLVTLNNFDKNEDIISEQEKLQQIKLAREIESNKYLSYHNSENVENVSINNYQHEDFININSELFNCN